MAEPPADLLTTSPPPDYDPVRLSPLPDPLMGYPLLPALVLGQLFNRLGFHCQQAYFFGRRHDHATRQLADELPRRVRGVVAVAHRENRERAVGEQLGYLHEALGSEEAQSSWEAMNCAIQALSGQERHDVDMSDRRLHLLGPIFYQLDQLRSVILADLDDETLGAFTLGEVIDRGLCPEDVYRDLDETLPRPPQVGFGGHREEPDLRLSARRCWPGDVAPRRSWWGNVQQRWLELRLSSAMPELPTRTVAELSWEQRRCLVMGLAGRAWEGLTELARSRMPTLELSDRLKVLDRGARTVSLDGKTYTIESPPPFNIFLRLIEANGELVATSILDKLPGCKSQLSKIVARLPTALKEIVIGNSGGGGGGYYLRLKPICP